MRANIANAKAVKEHVGPCYLSREEDNWNIWDQKGNKGQDM